MLNKKQKILIVIITIVSFVSIITVLWRIYMVPAIEEVFLEAANAPNPRVQEALAEPVVSAGLYALDGQTGQVQWSTQFEGIKFSDPAVAGDRIFIDIHTSSSEWLADFIISESDFVAIEAETGHEVRRIANHGAHDFEVVVKYPPIVTPDIMINDIGYSSLGAYEADTGELLYEIDEMAAWHLKPDDAMPVALTEGRLIVRHNLTSPRGIADTIQAYDLHSGDLLWSTSHEPYPEGRESDAVHLTPILTDDQRVFLEVVDQFQAFDIDSGDFLFALDQTCKRAEVQGSTLYCVNGDLKAFDTATGDLLWSFEPNIDLQEVEAVEDTIYLTTPAKRRQFLIAINPADGSERWRVRVWDSALSADEGTVFAIQVIKDQKALVALSATDGTQLWQFPLYSNNHYSPVSDGEQVYIIDIANR